MQRKLNQPSTPQQHSDMDAIDDMELDDAMDDTDASSQFFTPQPQNQNQGGGFGTPNRGVPNLNLTMLPNHQGFKGSQPGTPVGSGLPLSLQNNPTVSSVNTPTLMPNPLQNSQFRGTPDSSTPGTPAEIDDAMIGPFGELSMQNAMLQGQSQFSRFTGNDMVDLCIDEPAKRLFSPTGGINQSNAHFKLSGAQYGPNSDIARRIREQQMLAGVPDTTSILPNEEPKPYRCPVIGCEKAYKNQNGLKYHKAVGVFLVFKAITTDTQSSMDTTVSSCTTIQMALSRSSTRRHLLPTPERLVWKKRSHIAVRFVANATRT